MGVDGIMGKGMRYTPEFREKAVGLLAESRDSHSSETRALAQVAGNLGVAPETLRRWRNQADGAADARPRPRVPPRARAAGPTSWNAGSGRARRTGCT